MTIRDIVDAGIQIQGHEIMVKTWNERLQGYDILHHSMHELYGIHEAALDLEVAYIYAQNKTLVIEVEKRSY